MSMTQEESYGARQVRLMPLRERLKEDFTAPWQWGWEWIAQEGSRVWQRLREEAGLSRGDVEELTVDDGGPTWEQQTMYEDRPDFPDLQMLVKLAQLYEMTPGQLLDRVLTEEGMPRMADSPYREGQPRAVRVINVIGAGPPEAHGALQLIRWEGETDAEWAEKCAAAFRRVQ